MSEVPIHRKSSMAIALARREVFLEHWEQAHPGIPPTVGLTAEYKQGASYADLAIIYIKINTRATRNFIRQLVDPSVRRNARQGVSTKWQDPQYRGRAIQSLRESMPKRLAALEGKWGHIQEAAIRKRREQAEERVKKAEAYGLEQLVREGKLSDREIVIILEQRAGEKLLAIHQVKAIRTRRYGIKRQPEARGREVAANRRQIAENQGLTKMLCDSRLKAEEIAGKIINPVTGRPMYTADRIRDLREEKGVVLAFRGRRPAAFHPEVYAKAKVLYRPEDILAIEAQNPLIGAILAMILNENPSETERIEDIANRFPGVSLSQVKAAEARVIELIHQLYETKITSPH